MLTWLKSLLVDHSGEKTATEEKLVHPLSLNEMVAGVRDVFMERLGPLGFTHKGMWLIRKRCNIAHDKMYLEIRGGGDTTFRANLSIGIISEPVERLFAQLDERPYREGDSVTFALNLGYVMPRKSYLAWDLRRDHFPEEVARNMIETTLQYGLPYLEQFDNWETIYAEAARYGGDRVIRLPIIKYLMGQPEEAIRLMEAGLPEIETYGGAAEDYRKGAANLIALCKKGRDAM